MTYKEGDGERREEREREKRKERMYGGTGMIDNKGKGSVEKGGEKRTRESSRKIG
jgi:hypothetical protein